MKFNEEQSQFGEDVPVACHWCQGQKQRNTTLNGTKMSIESDTRTNPGGESKLQIKETSNWMSTGTHCVEYTVAVSG